MRKKFSLQKQKMHKILFSSTLLDFDLTQVSQQGNKIHSNQINSSSLYEETPIRKNGNIYLQI